MKRKNKKQQQFESHALILHCFIKEQLNTCNVKDLFDKIGPQLRAIINNKLNLGTFSYDAIDGIAKMIIDADSEGHIVYSCLSISILIHIYLCAFGIESNIIIGSCIYENKVYSHAWVKTIDNIIFDYRFDTFKYRELKKINIMEDGA